MLNCTFYHGYALSDKWLTHIFMMKESNGDPNPYLHMKRSNGDLVMLLRNAQFFSIVVFLDPLANKNLTIFCPKKSTCATIWNQNV
jgi:hypothetical protein